LIALGCNGFYGLDEPKVCPGLGALMLDEFRTFSPHATLSRVYIPAITGAGADMLFTSIERLLSVFERVISLEHVLRA
jgi:hypothetical protein